MRIGLLGQFGSGNSGNDGSLEAMVAFLRRAMPLAELVCICANPAAVEAELGIRAISISPTLPAHWMFSLLDALLLKAPRRLFGFFAAIAQTRRLDVVIIPGTGILDDFRERPSGWPYVLLRWCVAVRIGGARLAFVSVGAGPIRHGLSRRFMGTAARLACYRSYRDDISREFMAGIGIDVSRDPVYPDIAFSLPFRAVRARDAGVPLTVGVGVMSYFGWVKNASDGAAVQDAYIAKLKEFVLWLVEQGIDVRLLTGDRNDWAAVESLQADLARSGPPGIGAHVTAADARSLHDLLDQMAGTDLVVATRYHNVVCALRLGLPTISIGYADKNDVLLADMGLAEFCQGIDTLDIDRLQAQFVALRVKAPRLGPEIGRRVADYEKRLRDQEEVLLERVVQSRSRNFDSEAARLFRAR